MSLFADAISCAAFWRRLISAQNAEFTSGNEANGLPRTPRHNTDYLYPVREHNYRASESLRPAAQPRPRDSTSSWSCIDFKTSLAKVKFLRPHITGIIAQAPRATIHPHNANRCSAGLRQLPAASRGGMARPAGAPPSPHVPTLRPIRAAASMPPSEPVQIWTRKAPMLFDRGIVAPGVDAGYVDSENAFGGKAFPESRSSSTTGTRPFLKVSRNGERLLRQQVPLQRHRLCRRPPAGRVCGSATPAFWKTSSASTPSGRSAQTRNAGEDIYIKQMENAETEGVSLLQGDTIESWPNKLELHRRRQRDLPRHQ